MKIFVDIDETICYNPNINKTEARDYSLSTPIAENIKIINRFFDDGHEITYWTARGSTTGIDWYDVTKQQLIDWGAKHHELILGKPYYDLYIDDKSINSERFFLNNYNITTGE